MHTPPAPCTGKKRGIVLREEETHCKSCLPLPTTLCSADLARNCWSTQFTSSGITEVLFCQGLRSILRRGKMLLFSCVQKSQEFSHIHYEPTQQRLWNHLPEMIKGVWVKDTLYFCVLKYGNVCILVKSCIEIGNKKGRWECCKTDTFTDWFAAHQHFSEQNSAVWKMY